MANTYINLLVHIVFSTKNGEPFLTPDIRERLYPYMNAIAKEHNFIVLHIGGTSDHTHLLLSIPSTINLSDTLRFLKGGSSHWLRETFDEFRAFSWQEGYGAFSISESQIHRTREYIRDQEEHHKKVSFQDEYLAFLCSSPHSLDSFRVCFCYRSCFFHLLSFFFSSSYRPFGGVRGR